MDPHEMLKIIASILHPNKREVLMKVEDVQSQEDGIAVAYLPLQFHYVMETIQGN